jgi:predicted enzyme related to lactoylglutathione lyase
MANIGHFMIPADNVDRAKRFYSALLGWKIEPVGSAMDPEQMAAMQYHDITTGTAGEGTMNTGGLYKRHLTEPILNFVIVDDIDTVQAKVEKLGGKITMLKQDIAGVGLVVMIQDTEGNVIGLWKPARP